MRAWDKEKKEMIFDAIEYDLRMISTPHAEPLTKVSIGFSPETDGIRFEVMEWSGLKDDKTKSKIYEGDILKCTYMSKGIYYGNVVFEDGSFCLRITAIPETKKGQSTDYDIGQTPELNNFEWIEIIGNVFQGKGK